MITLPAGKFLMGASEADEPTLEYEHDYERPQRLVTVPRPFGLGRTTVTFAMWDAAVAAGFVAPQGAVQPHDEGWGRGTRPVIYVRWHDAEAYCEWLNERLGLRPGTYRLPSEAEWEYACRAGTVTPFSFGGMISPQQANHHSLRTVPVGSLPANPWGLCEMHGNVFEWVEDAFGLYPNHVTDSRPLAQADLSRRVLRGGSWASGATPLRSSYRFRMEPEYRSDVTGFRIARTLF